MEAAAGFEPAHNGFAVRSLNHLGTPPLLGGTHTYTTRAASDSATLEDRCRPAQAIRREMAVVPRGPARPWLDAIGDTGRNPPSALA